MPPEPVIPVPEVWHIGFTDVESSTHWLRRLLQWLPHPRHVVCFRDTPGGLLTVQQTLACLLVTIQPGHTAAGFAAEIEQAGGAVVTRTVTPETVHSWQPRPFNCVDIARAVVRLPYVPQTPRRFLRQLRSTKHGQQVQQSRT
jgi:hypothetical protein